MNVDSKSNAQKLSSAAMDAFGFDMQTRVYGLDSNKWESQTCCVGSHTAWMPQIKTPLTARKTLILCCPPFFPRLVLSPFTCR